MAVSLDQDVDQHKVRDELKKRLREAFRKRKQAARFQLEPPFPPNQPLDNEDEEKYPNKIDNFTSVELYRILLQINSGFTSYLTPLFSN